MTLPRFLRRSRPLLLPLLLLAATSCIFDTDPVAPGFPIDLMATVSLDTLGTLQGCAATSNGALLVSAGSRAAVIRMEDGTLVDILDIGAAVSDLGDTDASGYAYVLTDDRLIPIRLDSWEVMPPLPLGAGSLYLTVSEEAGKAWVADATDGLREVDLATGEVQTVPGKLFRECRGLVCSDDGTTLFAADGADQVVTRISTATWTPSSRLELYGHPVDLFRGPEGYVCCLVEGSNEIWFIDGESGELALMATVPEAPIAAAVMPDMGFSYATCPGFGLVVVAGSGQIEYRGADLGYPTSIAIRGDGNRTALCCPEEGVVRILD